jgi:hypothetical protein
MATIGLMIMLTGSRKCRTRYPGASHLRHRALQSCCLAPAHEHPPVPTQRLQRNPGASLSVFRLDCLGLTGWV